MRKSHFFHFQFRKNNIPLVYLWSCREIAHIYIYIKLIYSLIPLCVLCSRFIVIIVLGDNCAPARRNLITVDLGVPKQRPCRAAQNTSREHPVWGDRNIRRDRWLINHGGACSVSMGGLPLESSIVSRWAEGASAPQHDSWMHWSPNWASGWWHRGRFWMRETLRDTCQLVSCFRAFGWIQK